MKRFLVLIGAILISFSAHAQFTAGSVLTAAALNAALAAPTVTGGSINGAPVGNANPRSGAFTTLSTTGNVTFGAPVINYNGTSTVGNGIGVLVANVPEPNLTNNLPSTPIYTVPSGKSGWYEVRCNATVITPATTSGTLPSHTISGVNADSGGSITGNAGSTSGNTTSSWSQGILTMYLAAGSTLSASTVGYASNPANSMVYEARYLVIYWGP